MGELGAFLKIERVGVPYRDPVERAHDFQAFSIRRPADEPSPQGARCLQLGSPLCPTGMKNSMARSTVPWPWPAGTGKNETTMYSVLWPSCVQ